MHSLEHTPVSEAASTPKAQPSMLAGAGALALAGAGALALGALGAKPAQAITPVLKFSDIPGTGDVKVLNFALALEDLEAEAYAQAIQRLTTGGNGGRDAVPGTVITGLGLSTSQRDVTFIQRFGRVEQQHRDFLRSAITSAGGTPIAPFDYDFGIPTMTRLQVVTLIYRLEQGGVGAYLGGIPFFSTKTYLAVAAGILGTEARHTAIIANVLNNLAGRNTVDVAPLANNNNGRDTPVVPDDVLAAVSPFIVRPGSTNPA